MEETGLTAAAIDPQTADSPGFFEIRRPGMRTMMEDVRTESDDIETITRSDDLANLVVTFKAGRRVYLSAEKLRLSCKCAHCLRARIDQRFPTSFPGIAITGMEQMGYGFNIAFSDGHARGIYPLGYIASLLEP